MNNKTLSYVGIAIAVVALLISFGTFGGSKGSTTSNAVFDKVLSSGTLRAGYIVYPPYIAKDPKTGQLSGSFYDLTEAVGKQLGLKVEWVEEAGYGTIPESLSAGRYDMYAGIWANPNRSKAITFTTPAYYDAVYAYVKTADHRFDNNLDLINSPQIKVSTIDGELGDSIAKESFPNAQRVSLPQTSPFDQLQLQVVTSKADVVFLPPTATELFLKSNPGTLRKASEIPVRNYAATVGVKLGEFQFRDMLSVTIQELINTGEVNKILNKYDKNALPVAAPYKK